MTVTTYGAPRVWDAPLPRAPADVWAPVALHCLLAVLTMQAAALAQVMEGDLDRMRECARRVA